MLWLGGIDEAGYGPTLGPLVLSLVSIEAPFDPSPPGSLWRYLATGVCRTPTRRGQRVPIDDSKALYSPAQGLAVLEESVLGCLGAVQETVPRSFDELLRTAAIVEPSSYGALPWYRQRDLELPVAGDPARIADYAATLRSALAGREARMSMRCHAVDEASLNRAIAEEGNKARAEFRELVRLLRLVDTRAHQRDLRVDRLGGRVYYREPLAEAFPLAEITPLEEGGARSVYRVEGLFDRMRVEFRTGGDRHELTVALASMLSKYVRELFMTLLNRFFCRHVRDLRPTAGYYVDARRFLARIEPVAARLGIAEETLVRAR